MLFGIFIVKDALSGLRRFLANETLWKWWKMVFISPQKLVSFSRYWSFWLDFLVMYQNGLIKKIKFISNLTLLQNSVFSRKVLHKLYSYKFPICKNNISLCTMHSLPRKNSVCTVICTCSKIYGCDVV